MKLALVIAFAPDRHSGRVLGDVVAADAAIKTVKDAIAAGKCPDARYPNLAAVSLSDVIRQHRFQVSPADVAEASKAIEANVLVPSNFIPVQIGEGEQAVIINVTTDEEAKFLTQMADAMKGSIAEIEKIRLDVEDLTEDKTALVADLDKSHKEAAKVVSDMKTEADEVAKRNADALAKRDAAIVERDNRIKDLEAQLEAAKSAKKSK